MQSKHQSKRGKMMDLSVVIPCLNEEKTIKTCIDKCIEAFEHLKIEGEVIVCDNDSTDNSANLAKNAGAKVVYCKQKGYGSALLTGFNNATGKYIIMGDADNSYDFSEIPKFYEQIKSDFDLVIGSRFLGKIEKGAMPFLNQYLGNPTITFILNLLFGTKISDSQSGMRMIKKDSLEKASLKNHGMTLATEMIVEFKKKGLRIKEIPICLKKTLPDRIPHLRPWKDGFKIICYIFITKSKFLFKK